MEEEDELELLLVVSVVAVLSDRRRAGREYGIERALVIFGRASAVDCVAAVAAAGAAGAAVLGRTGEDTSETVEWVWDTSGFGMTGEGDKGVSAASAAATSATSAADAERLIGGRKTALATIIPSSARTS